MTVAMHTFVVLCEEDEFVLTRLWTFILGHDYVSLSFDLKRIRRRRVLLLGTTFIIFILASLLVLVLVLRHRSSLIITKEQARNFAGIVASIIPILVVALFVESSPRWNGQTSLRGKFGAKDNVHGSSLDEEKRFVSPIQLLLCLIGEIIALFSVLSPTTNQVRYATIAVWFLLFLFGTQLAEGILAQIRPDSSTASAYAGFLAFLLFMIIFIGYFALIYKISVIG